MQSPSDRQEKPLTQISSASVAARKTYWAHDPYATPDSDNARLAEISKTFIDLFYHALLKKECRVATAVEIEAALTFDKDPQLHKRALEELKLLYKPYAKNREKENLDAVKDYVNEAVGYKENEHFVTDRVPNGIYRAYRDQEVFEVATWPRKPFETVAYVKTLKKALLESSSEFKENAPDHTISRSAQYMSDALPIRTVRFGALPGFMKKEGGRNGEHINISLHHTSSDINSRNFDLGEVNLMKDKLYAQLVSDCLAAGQNTDTVLMLNAPASVTRMDKKFPPNYGTRSNPKRVDYGHQMLEKASSRVEWKVPDSSSDIHLTMLNAMTRLYLLADVITSTLETDALPAHLTEQQISDIRKGMEPYDMELHVVPAKQEERVALFEKSSLAVSMMKKVVAEAVPAEQQGKYFQMIDEFKAAAVRQSNAQFASEKKGR